MEYKAVAKGEQRLSSLCLSELSVVWYHADRMGIRVLLGANMRRFAWYDLPPPSDLRNMTAHVYNAGPNITHNLFELPPRRTSDAVEVLRTAIEWRLE